jgi:hypothetical protein
MVMSSAGAIRLPLSRGYETWVDIEDLPLLAGRAMHANVTPAGRVYAAITRDQRPFGLHRFLAGAERGTFVDHINGDELDNRRANLRLCTRKQNAQNRAAQVRSYQEQGRYLGVRRTHLGHWRATICGQQSANLGTYDTPEDAARAYDIAAAARYGAFASLNFPERLGEPPPCRRVRRSRRTSSGSLLLR